MRFGQPFCVLGAERGGADVKASRRVDRAQYANDTEHWIRLSTIDVVEFEFGQPDYVLVNKSFAARVRAQFLGMLHRAA